MGNVYDDYMYGRLTAKYVSLCGWPDYIEVDGIMWARIKDFGNNYYVSQFGDIMSFVRSEEKILAVWHNKHGHEYVELTDGNGYSKKVLVHRLVAEYFVPGKERGPIVRHLNDISDDNDYGNLAWGTPYDNVQDMRNNGHMFMKPVYCYETGKVYESCVAASMALGVDKSSITQCCQGKNHYTNGYHLCYLEDKNDRLEHIDEWLQDYDARKPVRAIRLSDGACFIFPSRKDAAEKLGVDGSSISSILSGRFYQTKGWTFEDLEPGKMYKVDETGREML